MPERRWTISVLTIPSRETYVQALVESLAAARVTRHADVSIVYNWDSPEPPSTIEQRLRRACRGVPIEVSFNTTKPTIAAGRQQQLNACKTPLICFIDDDVTVHGDLVATMERGLQAQPLGIVGVPSYVEGTPELFKPRESTPYVNHDGVRFQSVQGMLVGGYRRLFIDVGGFNQRRRYWGEWTELNLRLWRSGFPTGYVMDGAYLRHWHDAPESPTRNRSGREVDVLWGLMCTALEYDAVDITEETESFWRLVAERYLAYSFGPDVSPQSLLSAFLRLVPRLLAEWPRIAETREAARAHPFRFAPFAPFTPDEVTAVIAHASPRIATYRAEASRVPSVMATGLRRFVRLPWRALQQPA
ncbi:MAG: glycosyltransferase [Gemmatimonadaceae bacterium]|nr:glycosyltransferase [Gemmatimonadaceae bacterium]